VAVNIAVGLTKLRGGERVQEKKKTKLTVKKRKFKRREKRKCVKRGATLYQSATGMLKSKRGQGIRLHGEPWRFGC